MNFDKAIYILQLNRKYTKSELKKQYYSKALFFHPDKNKDLDAKDKFQEINSAYTFLSNYDVKNETNYEDLFNTFINSLFNNKIFNSINKEEVVKIFSMCNNISISVIKKMRIENIVYLYNIIKTYNSVFQLSDKFIYEISIIIKEKKDEAMYYILEPTLENMYNNEIFVIEHKDEKLSVPLWHSDLIYELNGEDIYVKCIPDISDSIYIDMNNNIHINIEKQLSELFEKEYIEYDIGFKIFYIPVEELKIKKYQNFVLKNKGISIIHSDKPLETSKRSDIIFYVKLI